MLRAYDRARAYVECGVWGILSHPVRSDVWGALSACPPAFFFA